jgi:putative ATP-binding cassette transporter
MVVLYLMAPLDVILTWIPVIARARASLQKTLALVPALERLAIVPAVRAGGAPAFQRAIELRGVRYAYEGAAGEAGFELGPIDLTLQQGELVFLAGGNGSGKTTLVKLLAGLYLPQAGTVAVDGRPVLADDLDEYRRLFSVVFADGYLFSRLHGLDRRALVERAPELLQRLELDRIVALRDGSFSTTDLSQGQRRRLALLTALLEDRPVYLLDEWAAHQDPHFRRVFYLELLPELLALGKSVLVITHDEDYFDMAGRVLRLHEGLVRDAGPAALAGRAAGPPPRRRALSPEIPQ